MDASDVLEFLGASGEETFVELTDLIRKKRTSDAIVLVAQALADGKDVRQFMRDWVNHYRNLLMTKFIKNPQEIINMSVENIDRIRRQSETIELTEINQGILELSRTINEAKWSTQPRILLELAIVKLSSVSAGRAPIMGMTSERMISSEPAGSQGYYGKPAGSPLQNATSGSLAESPASETGHAPDEDGNKAVPEPKDYDRIWKAVFEDGEASKGSFYIVGSGAALTSIEEHSFTVTVRSGHVKAYAERNRELLEALMERHTGKKRSMKIAETGAGAASVESEASMEDIAQEAEKLLGVNVEIK